MRAPSLESFGHAHRTGGAVALPHEEQRRVPRAVARAIDADRLGHRLNVAVRGVQHVTILLASQAAVAGADRVDEHEVTAEEPGFGSVHDLHGGSTAPLRVG